MSRTKREIERQERKPVRKMSSLSDKNKVLVSLCCGCIHGCIHGCFFYFYKGCRFDV